MSRGRAAEKPEILSVFMISGLFWLPFACCDSNFCLFWFGFSKKNPEVPPPRAAPGVALPGVCPTRGPRCGGDARGVPHPGATRGVALPGSARPRANTPVVDARGRPTSPRPGVVVHHTSRIQYLNSRWVLHPIRIQKKSTTRGPVTAAGGPQKARASHETDGVCPGSRRTNRFGRSIWASAFFSRAIGQRATKETRQRAFCGRRANHAGIFFKRVTIHTHPRRAAHPP